MCSLSPMRIERDEVVELRSTYADIYPYESCQNLELVEKRWLRGCIVRFAKAGQANADKAKALP